MADQIRRIGILGGTFNPIHLGHLIFAQSAAEALKLDSIWFMTAGNPPHKQHLKGIVSNEHRLEMVRLSIASNPDFELNTYEVEKNGLSYTHETLEAFKEMHPRDDYYFLIGQDSLRDFETWKHPEIIASQAHLVAAVRPGAGDKADIYETAERLSAKYNGDFIVIETPAIEISSSDIRKKVREMSSFRYLVRDEVFDYILKNHLYADTED